MAMELPETDINALPEECVANVISLTNPIDACRLSSLSSTFYFASESDAVWERFLPCDYLGIIGRSNVDLDVIKSFQSKKEIYLYLCDNHFLLEDGKKCFWLEKRSGKKCYMLEARDLKIVWGDSAQRWRWIQGSNSRFPEVAELVDVCWLDISGTIKTDMLSPNTTYVAYFVYTSTPELLGFDRQLVVGKFGITGEDSKPVSVCFGNLNQHSEDIEGPKANTKVKLPTLRDDQWMEVELGEFTVQGTEAVELEMSLKEVKGGHWKSGLYVRSIEIRPKRVNTD